MIPLCGEKTRMFMFNGGYNSNCIRCRQAKTVGWIPCGKKSTKFCFWNLQKKINYYKTKPINKNLQQKSLNFCG